MENKFSQLYQQFRDFVDTGTEEQAQEFIKQHINEFPPDVRDEIILAFFEEGIKELAEEWTGVAEFQEEVLEGVEKVRSNKRTVEDELKMLDLEEKLK